MSSVPDTAASTRSSVENIGFFERYLSIWVALCIVSGIALGHYFPEPFKSLGRMEIARVNVPVGLLIWVMIIPMLLRIDFRAIHQVSAHWRGIGDVHVGVGAEE